MIFVNEERAYLSWLAHHRRGFVMEMLRKPTRKSPVVHRAACREVKSSKSKKTHFTTGRHIKACSLDREELLAWAATEAGEPVYCNECKPTADDASYAHQERRLTKLGKDIVDYVVEAAVVCLDEDAPYDVTAGSVAAYLNKSPAQISSALLRLVEDDYLRIDGNAGGRKSLECLARIYPTADALRMLSTFEHMSPGEVSEELGQLADGQ